MRSIKGKGKGLGILALFLITGAILGGILGELVANSAGLAGMAPILVREFPIFDLPPLTINLYAIKLIIGFNLHPNLLSVIGIIAAIILYRRL